MTKHDRPDTKLLRAEKLATVGTLASGIAHEIGTPLGVVRGRAEYILEKMGPGHPQGDSLRVIIDQVDKITDTIQSLLDFANPPPATPGPVELEPLLARAIKLVEPEAARREVTTELIMADPVARVSADRAQLEQAVVNLLVNALQVSPEGSTVEVVVQDGEPNDIVEARHVRIEILDQGPGIKPRNRHRAFDPFFTTKKRGQRTGLGLAVVAQIARAHGAHAELHNRERGGARAVLLWPKAAEDSKPI